MIRSATIIGMGRVGGAIAARLRERSVHVVEVAHADFEAWTTSHTPVGNVLIIAVKDDGMADVVRAIAASHHSLINVIAMHVNGSLRPYALRPLVACGATIASAHPFQTFADADPSALDGIGWGVECTDADWPHMSSLVHMMGGVPVRLTDMTDDRKRVYHAAAVAASNFTYAAYQLGRDLAQVAGVPADIMLVPIMERTFKNAAEALGSDAPFAMTGPIVRGDVVGLRRQYEAVPIDHRDQYRYLALALLEIVRPTFDETTVREMMAVLA